MICTWCFDHSLAVVEVTDFLVVVGKGNVFLVAVGKVAVLEVVVAKVATTSNAVVIVASALLKVVDVKAVAPVLEGVDGKVEVLLVVFVMQPQQLMKRLRLEGTEL